MSVFIMKRSLFATLFLLAVGLGLSAQQSGMPAPAAAPKCDIGMEQPLFKTLPGQTPYRIPAIASTHNGTLLAITDYRPCGGDIGFGRVDLRYRFSANNGMTWSEELVLAEGDGIKGSPTCGYGDAAIVADSRSDEVIIVCVTGNTVYSHSSTTRQNPNRVAILRSHDNGHSWSTPQDITESVYSLFDGSRLGNVNALFFGSGRICQSRIIKVGRYYRLYAALCARPGGNRVVYSDDFGRTWKSLGSIHTSPAPEGDEPKIEELPNGNVVLSSRAWGGRIYNIYSYISRRKATGVWSEPVASAGVQGGVQAVKNSCNGEILIVDAIHKKSRKTVLLALQSVPLGPGRSRVGIYFKPLYSQLYYRTPSQFAADWKGPYEVSKINSAYSTMVQQPDGRIAFFYEEETYGQGAAYTQIYVPLCIEQITHGEFTAKMPRKNLLAPIKKTLSPQHR